MNSAPALFLTKTGIGLNGTSSESYKTILSQLSSECGISSIQICEGASYSMAMVVRYALGLSATGGKVTALVRDTLSGWIALATLRHLVNAGCEGSVILFGERSQFSVVMEQLLRPLFSLGLGFDHWEREEQNLDFTYHMLSCHNVLCGLYGTGFVETPLQVQVVDILNEIETPVHAIVSPVGMNVDTGKAAGTPLYASSTLSPGAPFIGHNEGSDFVGRHYVCDICIPRKLYEAHGLSLGGLFSEQPVLQITPIKTPEETPDDPSSQSQ